MNDRKVPPIGVTAVLMRLAHRSDGAGSRRAMVLFAASGGALIAGGLALLA
jgi:hypothetical protein